jgi:hypothetical protein
VHALAGDELPRLLGGMDHLVRQEDVTLHNGLASSRTLAASIGTTLMVIDRESDPNP